MFEVRYKDEQGNNVTRVLTPGPTETEYPDRRLFTSRQTQDGNVVIQRPLRDPRPRKWSWKGYRAYMPQYQALWELLVQLEYRYRVQHNLEPLIEIRDTTTGEGGFEEFTRVKVIQVTRNTRPGGGFVTYESTDMEFVIVDDRYKGF